MQQKHGFTGGLARATAQRPWRVWGLWAVLLVGAFFLAGNLQISDEGGVEDTEARRAIDFIEQLRGDNELNDEEFIVVEADASIEDTAMAALVTAIVIGVREVEVVNSAVSYLDGIPELRTADDRVAMIPITTTLTASDDIDPGLPILDVVDKANETPGFRVTSAGDFSFNSTFEDLAEETFAKDELIGLAAAVIILLIVFDAAISAALPILLALAAVFSAVGVVTAISFGYGVSTFTVIVLTMVGLALGIDYSLFIVQRFREERDRGFEKLDAITVTGSTASRTVLFSGFAVAVALAGMLIMPDRLFKSFGIGAVVVAITAVAGALTLLPALLGLLGDRVNWLTLPVVGRRSAPDSTTASGPRSLLGYAGKSHRRAVATPGAGKNRTGSPGRSASTRSNGLSQRTDDQPNLGRAPQSSGGRQGTLSAGLLARIIQTGRPHLGRRRRRHGTSTAVPP